MSTGSCKRLLCLMTEVMAEVLPIHLQKVNYLYYPQTKRRPCLGWFIRQQKTEECKHRKTFDEFRSLLRDDTIKDVLKLLKKDCQRYDML